MSKDTRLHYIRLIQYLDKMYDTLYSSNDMENTEFEYYNSMYFKNHKYVNYDANNMLLLCSIALMGLNKEYTEKGLNYKNYGYLIDYSVPSYESIVDAHMKAFNIPEKNRDLIRNKLISRDSKYKFLNDKRKYPTEYDKWLEIEEQKDLPNFNYNYLSCVRDAFMHSEYELKEEVLSDTCSVTESFATITNSDYKKLKGKIFLANFTDFIKFYYSNTAFYGIMNENYSLEFDTDEVDIKPITSEESLKEVLKSTNVTKMIINNDSLNRKETYEYLKLKDKGIIFDEKLDNPNVTYENVPFTDKDKETIVKLINKYYGIKYYSYPKEEQYRIILFIAIYLKNPKIIFSSGITAIYENVINYSRHNDIYVNLSPNRFAIKPIMLLLKSYMVLYRLQNKSFEEIDYTLMDLPIFTYNETDPYNNNLYTNFKNKLINKGIIEEDSIYQRRYFTEIFRDALAHGNISLNFDNDEEQLVFSDIYKGKTREISISLSELYKYLKSECFSRSGAILKEETESVGRK